MVRKIGSVISFEDLRLDIFKPRFRACERALSMTGGQISVFASYEPLPIRPSSGNGGFLQL